MSSWLFQGVPRRYDIAVKLVAGDTEVWRASRYAGEMEPGDRVYFWRAGDPEQRGIYGWGTIVGPVRDYGEWGIGVPVRYDVRLERHIPAADLAVHPDFADHLIFRMALGTNFEVSPAQDQALQDLSHRRMRAAEVAG